MSNNLRTFVGELRLHMLNKKIKYGVSGLRRSNIFWINVLLTTLSSANVRSSGILKRLRLRQFLLRKRDAALQTLRLRPKLSDRRRRDWPNWIDNSRRKLMRMLKPKMLASRNLATSFEIPN